MPTKKHTVKFNNLDAEMKGEVLARFSNESGSFGIFKTDSGADRRIQAWQFVSSPERKKSISQNDSGLHCVLTVESSGCVSLANRT